MPSISTKKMPDRSTKLGLLDVCPVDLILWTTRHCFALDHEFLKCLFNLFFCQVITCDFLPLAKICEFFWIKARMWLRLEMVSVLVVTALYGQSSEPYVAITKASVPGLGRTKMLKSGFKVLMSVYWFATKFLLNDSMKKQTV